jgi:hypothetical protein
VHHFKEEDMSKDAVMAIINRVRQDGTEVEVYSDAFLVTEPSISDPEASLRSLASTYLFTEDGLKSLKHSCEDFNWGDLIQEAPNALFEKYGFFSPEKAKELDLTLTGTVTIQVDQDEHLFEVEHLDALEKFMQKQNSSIKRSG